MKTAEFGDVAAGAGIGLLVGLLLGLSVSSIVGSVIGSLAAVLATFLGLSAGGKAVDHSVAAPNPLRWARIASFGFCCSGAVILGIEARSHNWFGTSPSMRVTEWQKAGFAPREARDMVAFEQLGLVPQGRTISAESKLPPSNTTLYAYHASTECDALGADRFGSPKLRVAAFRNAGGSWSSFAGATEGMDDAHLAKALDAAFKLACGEEAK